jgi:Na+-driven multidrug efflux pump
MLQMLLATAAWMFMMSLVGRFGSAAQAGYTIAIRILIVAILPSWGMSNAGATLVGQNLGAQKPDRAERSVWLAGHSNAIFLAGVTLVCVFGAEWLVRWFTDDAEVIHHASNALRYISYGYVFYGYGMVMASAFNGAGDTWTPTKLNIICFWLLQIPGAWMLSQWTGLREIGVFIAITAAESILAVLAMLVFRQGKWKAAQV